MANRYSLRVGMNDGLALDAIRLLAQVPESAPQLVQRTLDLIDSGSEVFRVDLDDGTAPARQIRVRLEPSDRLLDLLAAVRARNADRV